MYLIALTGEMYVNVGTIISSLFFKFNASKAKCKAAVPLETDKEYLILRNFENFFITSSPPSKDS